MTFAELLQKNKDGIVRRWLDAALATYGDDTSAVFRRQKDPFANPVGVSLRTAVREVFEALLDGADSEAICRALHETIKIRAVQQFSASQALRFIFDLKNVIRAELGSVAGESRFSAEFAEFDGQIDQIALVAFDIFVQCREQVYELRVNEVKRQVSWVMEKMNQRDPGPQSTRPELSEGV